MTTTVKVTDSAGLAATKTINVVVNSPTQSTKIGQSIGVFPVPAPVTSFATNRYFFQAGDWNSSQTFNGQANMVKAYNDYDCRSFSISLKPDSSGTPAFGTTSVTNIRRFLDSCPDDAEMLVTFYHEHDGNIRDGSLTVARYKQGADQLANIVHEHGHKYGPIHNGMVYDVNKTPKWGLYSNIWAANESNVELYDFWGADCYSENYEAPSPRMNPLKTYADSLGLPLLIGEMASPRGTQQAAWAAAARTWALSNTKWAHWWHSRVGGATNTAEVDWGMTDAAARAWYGI
jgi:hypothetical protein